MQIWECYTNNCNKRIQDENDKLKRNSNKLLEYDTEIKHYEKL